MEQFHRLYQWFLFWINSRIRNDILIPRRLSTPSLHIRILQLRKKEIISRKIQIYQQLPFIKSFWIPLLPVQTRLLFLGICIHADKLFRYIFYGIFFLKYSFEVNTAYFDHTSLYQIVLKILTFPYNIVELV